MKKYKKLLVWKRIKELIKMVYKLTAQLPEEEKYGLRSQARRSVTSIALNFAEGWGRRSSKQFNNFIKISEGSLLETEAATEIINELFEIDQELVKKIENKANEVGYLLYKFKKGVKEKSRTSRTSRTSQTL